MTILEKTRFTIWSLVTPLTELFHIFSHILLLAPLQAGLALVELTLEAPHSAPGRLHSSQPDSQALPGLFLQALQDPRIPLQALEAMSFKIVLI